MTSNKASKIVLMGFWMNPVLKEHMIKAFPKNRSYLFEKKERGNIYFFKCFFLFKDQIILIYNTSIINLLTILILKLRGNKVIFHLHDPIPHSGLFNPIIYLVNFLIVRLSSDVLVFSKKLKEQTKKYYLKTPKIVTHGMPEFNYKKTTFKDSKKIIIGFFGRNMPYKNYNRFLNFVSKNPEFQFITVGAGYPESEYKNLKVYSGYINIADYYSLMLDTDYIFFSHSKISYSGVLSDCLSLKKRVIFDSDVFEEITYPFNYSTKSLLTKSEKNSVNCTQGWSKYNYEINNYLT